MPFSCATHRRARDLRRSARGSTRSGRFAACPWSPAASAAISTDTHAAGLLADLQDRIRRAGWRLTEITEEQFVLAGELVDEVEVARVLAEFGNLWGALTPREQTRVVELLVERVDYDGQNGSVSITFRPAGIKTLGAERDETEEYAA